MWSKKILQFGDRSFYRYKTEKVSGREKFLNRKPGEEPFSFDVVFSNLTYLWLSYLCWDGGFQKKEKVNHWSEFYVEYNNGQSYKLELTKPVKNCCFLSQTPDGKRTVLDEEKLNNFGLTFKRLDLEVVGLDDVGLGRTIELRIRSQPEWNENTLVVSFMFEKEENIGLFERHSLFWLGDYLTITLGKK